MNPYVIKPMAFGNEYLLKLLIDLSVFFIMPIHLEVL